MSCDNLSIPKPSTTSCLTNLFGIPYQTAGRTVAGDTFPVSAIVLHCEKEVDLCSELKCRTKSSVITGSHHNSYHYSIGASTSPLYQHTEDGNISWTWNTYKNNTYATVPPPAIAFNWPVLQAEHGINTTPDVYTIDIALGIGQIVEATFQGCYECPTSSGLQESQHEILVQLLAYLAQEHNIPIDTDHIQFHDNIDCGEGEECPCVDIATLIAEVAAYCPPCDQEAPTAPEAEPTDEIQYIMGVTEPCCPVSTGCYVQIPWNACFIGDLAIDGTLDSYILGLAQDPATDQWCLTRGCLAVQGPLIGCGTVDDPLRLDLCLFGDWVPDEPFENMVNVLGIDDAGCLIEAPLGDVVQGLETPITVVDTDCIDLTVSGTSDHTLQADIVISPQAGNIVECLADGLFADVDPVTCEDMATLFTTTGLIDLVIGFDDGAACVSQSAAELVNNAICSIATDMAAEPTWLLGQTAGECPVFVTPESIVNAGFDVVDTDCIDLDWTGNQLSATPILNPAANNLLTCGPNGLLVPDLLPIASDCIDVTYIGRQLTIAPIISPAIAGVTNVLECTATGFYVPRGADALVNGPLVGNGADNNPLDVDFTLLDAQDLCDFGSTVPSGALVDLLGRDLSGCLRVQTVGDVVAGGLVVNDSNCIDLSLVGNVLTATPILSGAIAGFPNALFCTPTGLYISIGAGLTPQDTNCIDLDISAPGVISATVNIDPAGDNALVCGLSGLYVPESSITVLDTDCINLNFVGNILSATPILAPAQGGTPNVLSCIPGQGLYVPESAAITTVDTTCIDLNLVGGILSADIIIDPTGDNQVQCLPSGLYVPPSSGLIANDTNCISLSLAGGDTLTASPILAPAQAGVPNVLTCLVDGLYVPQCSFFITDDIGSAIEEIDCGDTITFDGIDGATVRITATDTVTISGHMLCGNGIPAAIPPYDDDQAWIHIDSSDGTTYTWNCDINKWETCLTQFEGTAPPDGTECATPVALNAVTNGNWCSGITLYHIAGGAGSASVDRAYQLKDGCEWVQVEGFRETFISMSGVLIGVPEGISPIIPFDTIGDNFLGIATPPSITVEEGGCYTIETNMTISITAAGYDGIQYRTSVFVNGINTEHVAETGGWSMSNPSAPAPVTTPLAGSQTLCLNAGDVITIVADVSGDGQIGTYDVVLASLKMLKLT